MHRSGESKPIEHFYRAAGIADGHRSDCIPCNLAAKKARTALDPQANRDRVRRWQLGDLRRIKGLSSGRRITSIEMTSWRGSFRNGLVR